MDMTRRKRTILNALIIGIALIIYLVQIRMPDKLYVYWIKWEIYALANDKATTYWRIASLKQEEGYWTDGRVGVTKDGYIFYYELHESHGADIIDDIHILYLPDEKRFLMNHDHFCCDLNKFDQAPNKAAVMSLFR